MPVAGFDAILDGENTGETPYLSFVIADESTFQDSPSPPSGTSLQPVSLVFVDVLRLCKVFRKHNSSINLKVKVSFS